MASSVVSMTAWNRGLRPSLVTGGRVARRAAVTVLSTRTTLPLSNLSCRALASSILLTASQVSARIALIVLCKTDFFGLHPHGSRAKARNEAESSR